MPIDAFAAAEYSAASGVAAMVQTPDGVWWLVDAQRRRWWRAPDGGVPNSAVGDLKLIDGSDSSRQCIDAVVRIVARAHRLRDVGNGQPYPVVLPLGEPHSGQRRFARALHHELDVRDLPCGELDVHDAVWARGAPDGRGAAAVVADELAVTGSDLLLLTELDELMAEPGAGTVIGRALTNAATSGARERVVVLAGRPAPPGPVTAWPAPGWWRRCCWRPGSAPSRGRPWTTTRSASSRPT
jgi:hypothetical protein